MREAEATRVPEWPRNPIATHLATRQNIAGTNTTMHAAPLHASCEIASCRIHWFRLHIRVSLGSVRMKRRTQSRWKRMSQAVCCKHCAASSQLSFGGGRLANGEQLHLRATSEEISSARLMRRRRGCWTNLEDKGSAPGDLRWGTALAVAQLRGDLARWLSTAGESRRIVHPHLHSLALAFALALARTFSLRSSPGHMPLTPRSQPWITFPLPSTKSKGVPRSSAECHNASTTQ